MNYFALAIGAGWVRYKVWGAPFSHSKQGASGLLPHKREQTLKAFCLAAVMRPIRPKPSAQSCRVSVCRLAVRLFTATKRRSPKPFMPSGYAYGRSAGLRTGEIVHNRF